MIKIKKTIKSNILAKSLQLTHFGKVQDINNISALAHPNHSSLLFSRNKLDEPIALSTCFVPDVPSHIDIDAALIKTSNPRLDFIRAINFLIENNYVEQKKCLSSIDSTAIIAPTAIIEEGSTIGAGTIISAGSVIKSGCTIGSNCHIHEGAVVGAEGFGFERDANNIPIHFTHLGGVTIEDGVYVGACSVISKGALTDTWIKSHAKINARVLVGHNVVVGKATYLHAGVVVSGGCKIGSSTWVGTNSTVLEKRVVGDHCIIGSGAVVNKNVESGSVVVGNPARKIKSG